MADIISNGMIFLPLGRRDWQWEAEDGTMSARIREDDGRFRAILLVENFWRKELPLTESGQKAADAIAAEVQLILGQRWKSKASTRIAANKIGS